MRPILLPYAWLLVQCVGASTLSSLLAAEGTAQISNRQPTQKGETQSLRLSGSALSREEALRSEVALEENSHYGIIMSEDFQQPSMGFNRQEVGSMNVAATTQFASFGSSLLAAFSLTLVTEVGDRTFFVAALLAAQYNKWQVWLGGVSALWTQTVLCAMIGAFLHTWQFKSSWMSWPIDDYLAGTLLLAFGILHIREGLASATEESENDKSSLEMSPSSALLESGGRKAAVDKRRGSAVSLRHIEQAREQISTTTLAKNQSSIVLHSFWLVMAAEIGDRSMFSTIALAAAQNPWGVALGAAVGHSLVTAAAVTCAALLSQFLNERITSVLGGLLFVAFGMLSLIEGLVRQGIL